MRSFLSLTGQVRAEPVYAGSYTGRAAAGWIEEPMVGLCKKQQLPGIGQTAINLHGFLPAHGGILLHRARPEPMVRVVGG